MRLRTVGIRPARPCHDELVTAPLPLSVLDLAPTRSGAPVSEALAETVAVAQEAERSGYRRVWYAEHHNMAAIASSATAVLIAHVAAHTSTIRLGSGGVMLPNHSPLVIAEQFGTLAELHPGRIDLGLGRAPGTDQVTLRALRRTPESAESFPADVIELGHYLGDDLPVSGVNAYPGRGTRVPRFILGSSMFGADLAAKLGLPFAFASHFAPDALHAALAHYTSRFTPSNELAEPHAIAAVNVVAAESEDDAAEQLQRVQRERVRRFLSRGREREFTDEESHVLVDTAAGRQILAMGRYTAAGSPAAVAEQLAAFAADCGAHELITVHAAMSLEQRLASLRLTAEAWASRD